MFYDMHIGFAVRARRLENAAGRSNIKKTQQRRIDPDLCVPSIVTKANIPLENILIDKNDKENGVSLWLIARKYPASSKQYPIFETNVFTQIYFLLFLSLSVRKLSNELKRKLEIQQGRKRILRTRRKSGEICTKMALIPSYPREYPRRSVYSWLELLRLPAASVNICPFRLNVIVSSGKLQR